MELKLRLAQQQEKRTTTNMYNIVAGSPIQEGREVRLYLAPSDLSDVISYAEAPNLDEAIVKLFDESINNRLDGGDSTRPDFLGWPVYFTSFGFLQAGGNDFFGYDPFVAYPIPHEALLKFAHFYTDRVVEAKKQERQP